MPREPTVDTVDRVPSRCARKPEQGVETTEQLDFLRGLDWNISTKPLCDQVQGFLLGKPLPAEGATTLLCDARGRRTQLRQTGT